MKHLVVGILAHVDAGKTTLSEALLFLTGKIRKLGRVDHRNTYLDTHVLERERGITIFSKQARLETDTMELTLLDTPGHADFSGEMERTLPAMDYAILVISGIDGVQAHTETLWELLERYSVPTFIFVTKMDATNLSKETLSAQLTSRLNINCFDLSSRDDEAIAMTDETVLDKYLETGSVSDEDIKRLIKERKLFPVSYGSGLKLNGIESFLHLLDRYTLQPEYPSTFGARVYKISRDSQNTRLTYLKVTGGSISVRDLISYRPAHSDEILEEKVSALRLYSGSKFENVQTVQAGSVCAVCGLSGTWAGQGLGSEKDTLPPLLTPALSYRVAIPKSTDVRTLLPQLRQLEEEEPLLHIIWQSSLSEIHIQLMGAVQIDVIKSLIKDRFGHDIQIDTGRILYRETIENTVEGVGHFEPLRHYAEVHLLMEPGPQGSGLVFDSKCSEDLLDLNWQRLILTHLEEKQHLGVLTGSPLTDVKITLLSGRAHLKHTEGGDFRQATYRAVRQGLMKAKSVLLEPYYAFHLEVPPENLGRAISDLHALGARHAPPESMDDRIVIEGTAPVSTMSDYMTDVASYTHGRGRLICRMDSYQPCRNSETIIEKIGYDPESDLDNTPDSVFCAHGAGFTVKWDHVSEFMHVDSGLSQPKEELSPQPRIYPQNLNIDEKELEAIMEREFGPIRRKTYSAPVINSAIGIEMQSRKQKERVIVDGYNVIYAWDNLKELAATSLDLARGHLIDILVNYQAYTKSEIAVVFDAYRVSGGQGEKYNDADVHVAFTKEGETADMYIERLVNNIGKNETVRIITSDSLISLTALRSGVMHTSSREFKNEVDWVLEQIAGLLKQNG